jgi:O-antigen ligase
MHFARFGKTPRVRQASTASALVLLASIPMSVSRSGILVVLVAIGVYAVTLSVRQRVTALVLGIAGLALYRAAVPGLLGAVVGIFRQSSDDTSVDSRTRSWTVVAEFFEASPWLGHGLGTFRPEEYIYLDNQYLMSLVEGGLVLLVTTVIVILLSLASTRGAKARARNATDVSLSQAVQAAVAAIAVSGAFFDLFSFAQVTVMFFVLLGVSGALWHDAVLHGRVIPSALERAGLPDPRTGPLAPERH